MSLETFVEQGEYNEHVVNCTKDEHSHIRLLSSNYCNQGLYSSHERSALAMARHDNSTRCHCPWYCYCWHVAHRLETEPLRLLDHAQSLIEQFTWVLLVTSHLQEISQDLFI